MNKILLTLLAIFILACNKYEVLEPSVQVRIHALDEETNELFTGYKGIIRVSNFTLATSSTSFFEDEESVHFDSAFVNNNGDLLFEIPFMKGIPQNYYELYLSKDNEIPVSEGRFIHQYIQNDTFRIGDFTQIDVKIRNDSCRSLSFSTLGYRTKADYKQDSINRFSKPDYVARLPITNSKDTVISKILPFYCNNFIVFQMLDRSVAPPLLINYDVIEMMRDSATLHCIHL